MTNCYVYEMRMDDMPFCIALYYILNNMHVLGSVVKLSRFSRLLSTYVVRLHYVFITIDRSSTAFLSVNVKWLQSKS